MCGINGITWSDRELIERMNGSTKHRGPDGAGIFVDEHISFGHNLLAITDKPDKSAQPVVGDEGRYVLIYNGEIYNYRLLRSELEHTGDVFVSDADTEVLFAGLRRHGPAFLEKLDGMFALAWYDRNEQTVLLVRDPSGMKPVYWTIRPEGLGFSSELRGLLELGMTRRLDTDAAALYFGLGYVPGPRTLVSGIRKLGLGQRLTYHLDTGTITTAWFGRRMTGQVPDGESGLRDIIGTAVRQHTMGLRPFGMYLSGGLDSTIILHELSRVHQETVRTYTTRFAVDGSGHTYNEDADTALRLCKDYNIDHHELEITESDFIGAIPKVIQTVEEPRFNVSIAAYWLLAQHASRDIVVLLSGSGGDELFLGYPHYRMIRDIDERLRSWPAFLVDAVYSARAYRRGNLGKPRFLRMEQPLWQWIWTNRLGARADLGELHHALREPGYPAVEQPLADSVNAYAELDRTFWLADEEFLRADKISMHFGMEGRFPMMANTLVTAANAIPSARKLEGRTGKKLLRDAYRGHLPSYIVDKPKTGWKAPVAAWMSSRLGELAREVMSPHYYDATAGLADFSAFREQLDHPDARHSSASVKRLFAPMSFQMWARQFRITL